MVRTKLNSERLENYYKFVPNLEYRNEVVQEFAKTFIGMGIRALINYPIAGIEMDLVLMSESETLAIDLVGFPGEGNMAFHLDRYKIFERAGLRIIPVSFTGWRLKKKNVIDSIKQTFVYLKEENTVARLSVADFSHHWTKLLAENPVLANNVRNIEADLVAMKCNTEVVQLGGLIDQYHKVIWVLNEKLNPNELTHARYTSSSEQVLLSGIDNLSQVSMLHKSLVTNKNELSEGRQLVRDEKSKIIERLRSDNSKAIQSLESLALKWSKTKTFNNLAIDNMESALSDLEELSERIENYN